MNILIPLLFILATDISIYFDIPLVRQFLGFIFLTILPGFLLFNSMNLKNLAFESRFLLYEGLSVSSIMFIFIGYNFLMRYLGYKYPLLPLNILLILNFLYIITLSLINVINENEKKKEKVGPHILFFNLNRSEKIFLIPPVIFPGLSIIGIYRMNTINDNSILMILFLCIILYYIFSCFIYNNINQKLFPLAIFLISISLLLLISLRSNYIIGTDAHYEYYHFQSVLENHYWSVLGYSTLDSCLCISLLPTIYTELLKIPPQLLFKIIFSLLFSISPIVIYILSKEFLGNYSGFLTSLFYMSQYGFKMTPAMARINIAIFFFSLALMIIVQKNIEPFKKKILFIIFSSSMILSHYSTTYIYIFLILLSILLIKIMPPFSYLYPLLKDKKDTYFTLKFSMLFLVLIFLWYGIITGVPFDSGVFFITKTINNMIAIMDIESRSNTIQLAMGKGIHSIASTIELIISWVTIACISIGITAIVINSLKVLEKYRTISRILYLEIDYLNPEIFIISVASYILLLISVIAPQISHYGIERVYFQLCVPLSISFSAGCKIISRTLKINYFILVLTILIPYFLCVMGVTYQILGPPREITLNSYGSQYDLWYIHDQEYFSAIWLYDHHIKNKIINTDFNNKNILLEEFGATYPFDMCSITNKRAKLKDYIYLRYYNIIDNRLIGCNKSIFNITEFPLNMTNKIYINRGSDVLLSQRKSRS